MYGKDIQEKVCETLQTTQLVGEIYQLSIPYLDGTIGGSTAIEVFEIPGLQATLVPSGKQTQL